MNINTDSLSKLNVAIFPMINELVDSLYTDEINNLIESKCQTIDDKRVFLMFLIIYFYTYLNIADRFTQVEYNSNSMNLKNELKFFLTDLICDPNKRSKCIELYLSFEQSIKTLKN